MKNILLSTFVASLLFTSLATADNNLTKSPFANNPMFQHFQKMQEEMDRVFSEFSNNAFKGFAIKPNTDLVDKGKNYELKMDLAGMDDKSIKIEVKDNYLSVQAKSESKKEQKEGDKIIHQERHVGVVQRGMTLPKDADAKQYKSEYKNGVLTITIPKKK